MKILLADNPTGYNNALSQLNTKKGRLQDALAAYTALGVATVPTTADLADLWDNPKVFLGRMLLGGQPAGLVGGLAVEPARVYDLVQKPAGTDAFLAAVETLHNPEGGWEHPRVDTTIYELVNGVVQIKQATLDSLREQFRIYATSQRQKDEWDALQIVVGGLETIRQNGRMGSKFEPVEYLRRALVNEGWSDAFNPVQASAAYVVQLP